MLPGRLGLSKAFEPFYGLLEGAALRQSPFLLAVASLFVRVIRKDPMGQVVAPRTCCCLSGGGRPTQSQRSRWRRPYDVQRYRLADLASACRVHSNFILIVFSFSPVASARRATE